MTNGKKPKSKKEAREMLIDISGKMVEVLSAFSVVENNKKISKVSETKIFFKKITKGLYL